MYTRGSTEEIKIRYCAHSEHNKQKKIMVDGQHIRLVLTYITDMLTCKVAQKFPIQHSIQLHNNMADIRYNNRGIAVPIFVTMEIEYLYTTSGIQLLISNPFDMTN